MKAAVVGFTNDFELGNWFNNQVIDNGTTSISPVSGPAQQATFGYELQLNSGGFARQQSVDFLTSAATAGTVALDYEFNGNSRFFRAGAQFDTVSGDDWTTIVDASTRGSFSFSGSATFDARQGEEFGFRIGGSNSDSNRNIFGNLTVSNIVFDFENTIVVDSATDLDDGDTTPGNVSLREAVRIANEVGYIDTISFDPGLVGETITLTAGQLDLTNDVTIMGLGADKLTISGNDASRIFSSAGDHTINLQDLTLTNGAASGASDNGGAILVDGGVAILDRVVVQNSTAVVGSAIDAIDGRLALRNSSIVNNLGGNSTIRLTDSRGEIETSTISGNDGIGFDMVSFTSDEIDELIVTSSTVVENTGGGVVTGIQTGEINVLYQGGLFADNGGDGSFGESFSFGGARAEIQSLGFNLLDDTPTGESTHDAGINDQRNTDPLIGSLGNNGGPTPTHALLVGSPAIDAGPNSQAPDQRGNARPVDQPDVPNVAGGFGTDIGAFELLPPETPSFVVDTTLDIVDDRDQRTSLREAVLLANSTSALDTITFDASLAGQTVVLTEGELRISRSLTVQGLGADQLTISGNNQSRIFNEVRNGQLFFTVNDMTLADGNSPNGGGGVLISNGGDVTFNRVVMTGNGSQNTATAIVVGFGRLNINDSSIVDNLSSGVGAVRVQDNTTVITNTTISGNGTRGISFFSASTSVADRLKLTNVTIANNAGEAIEIVANAGTMLLEYQNTIFADDGTGNGRERIAARGGNLAGLTITSLGYNLLQETPTGDATHDAATGDLRDVNALLGPLADNGGSTPTHALLEGSPAINAGSNALAVDSNGDPLLSDQRGEGFARISGGTADIGAFERDTSAPQVDSILINNGDVQRSIVDEIAVSFSEVVGVSASDFLLESLGDGTNVTPDVSTEIINGKTIATLTFTGDGIVGGSLADGNYRLTAFDAITDATGNALDGNGDGQSGGNATDEFFRFFGDTDGDRDVDGQDYGRFGLTFLRSSTDSAFEKAYDFDGDGDVDGQDYGQFGLRFLQQLQR